MLVIENASGNVFVVLNWPLVVSLKLHRRIPSHRAHLWVILDARIRTYAISNQVVLGQYHWSGQCLQSNIFLSDYFGKAIIIWLCQLTLRSLLAICNSWVQILA